jgi:hypothetical protein
MVRARLTTKQTEMREQFENDVHRTLFDVLQVGLHMQTAVLFKALNDRLPTHAELRRASALGAHALLDRHNVDLNVAASCSATNPSLLDRIRDYEADMDRMIAEEASRDAAPAMDCFPPEEPTISSVKPRKRKVNR